VFDPALVVQRHEMCDAALQVLVERSECTALVRNNELSVQRHAGTSEPSKAPFAAFEGPSVDTAAGMAAGHAIQRAGMVVERKKWKKSRRGREISLREGEWASYVEMPSTQ
jgi:hypothetical protein